MVYILNTSIKDDKKLKIALQKIFGIGKFKSYQICDQLGMNYDMRLKSLTNIQIEKLVQYINYNYIYGSELKRLVGKNIQRLIRIASYRGFRHIGKLPVRGQRTHSNAKTSRKLKRI
jgi:small subunit ribosomal protein S13